MQEGQRVGGGNADWSGRDIDSVEALEELKRVASASGTHVLNLTGCRVAEHLACAMGEVVACLHVKALSLRDVRFVPDDTQRCHDVLLGHVCRLLCLEFVDIGGTKASGEAVRSLVATFGVRQHMRRAVFSEPMVVSPETLLQYLPARMYLGVRSTSHVKDEAITWSQGCKGAFADVVALVKKGDKPSNVRDDIDDSTDKSALKSHAKLTRPRKPWEKSK